MAITHAAVGDYDAADGYFERLFGQAGQVGLYKATASSHLYALGRARWLQGRLEEARQVYVQMREGEAGSAAPVAGAVDTPDIYPTYPEAGWPNVDRNCDGVDGDVNDAVFLDPVGGDDTHTGLSQTESVARLDTALDLGGVAGEFLAEGDRGGIHEVGAARLEDVVELGGLRVECICQRIEGFGDDQESIRQFGIEVVTQLCGTLLDSGAPGLHFYTMNQAGATLKIWRNLGLDQAQPRVNE